MASTPARQRRRQVLAPRSRGKGDGIAPALARRLIQASLAAAVLTWVGITIHFLAKDDHRDMIYSSLGRKQREERRRQTEPQHAIALDLDDVDLVDVPPTTTVRVSVLSEECPKAREFLRWIIENQKTECRPCTIYRGEPVPSYWGSKDYPDRWDNGGRWGPPYALVQGGFPNTKIHHVEREMHRPTVERGMVAWAGPKGTHFFVALADHPEWKHEHTVWGRVFEEDMHLLDELVKERPLTVLEKNVPVVTNFVDPITFRIRELAPI